MNRVLSWILTFALYVVLASGFPLLVRAAEENDVLAGIEKLVQLGDKAPQEMWRKVADKAEQAPDTVTEALLPKLKDAAAKENALIICVWALGRAGDQRSVTPIMRIADAAKADDLKMSAWRALAAIGDMRGAEYMLSKLDTTKDGNMRFELFNLLGEMQYEPALPRMAVILNQEASRYYWQSIFAFGKMGDKAIPFLLKRIDDRDKNVRMQAVMLLGEWLMAPEAAKPLLERYWKEKDPEVRGMILCALVWTLPSLGETRKFLEDVLAKEKNKTVRECAQEVLTSLPEMEKKLRDLEKERKVSSQRFKAEWERIYKSSGKEGDYKALSAASTNADEPELKRLRERILQRDSDECFYDYQKVNETILLNRLFAQKGP
jgi:HEAT repeat protein